MLTHDTVHYTRTHITSNCALRVDLASFSEFRSCFHNNTSFSIYCLSPSSSFFFLFSHLFHFRLLAATPRLFCVYTFCGSWTSFFLVVGKRTPPAHTHGTLTTPAPFFSLLCFPACILARAYVKSLSKRIQLSALHFPLTVDFSQEKKKTRAFFFFLLGYYCFFRSSAFFFVLFFPPHPPPSVVQYASLCGQHSGLF